jgi:hypothetical protein
MGVTMAKSDKSQVSVLLVGDHAVVREGYRRLLERHGGIAVIGEAAGNRYLSADIAQKLALREFASQKTEGLSTRELEVLRWLAPIRRSSCCAGSMSWVLKHRITQPRAAVK